MCGVFRSAVCAAFLVGMFLISASGCAARTGEHSHRHGEAAAPVDDASIASAEAVTLSPGEAAARVNGLSCPLCAESLIATVDRIDGVDGASLDLGTGTLRLQIGKRPPEATAIARAVNDAGFTFVGFVEP